MLLDVVTISYGGPVLDRLGEALAYSAGTVVIQVHMYSFFYNVLLHFYIILLSKGLYIHYNHVSRFNGL